MRIRRCGADTQSVICVIPEEAGVVLANNTVRSREENTTKSVGSINGAGYFKVAGYRGVADNVELGSWCRCSNAHVTTGSDAKELCSGAIHNTKAVCRSCPRVCTEIPASIIAGAVCCLGSCVQDDVLGSGRSRSQDVSIHVELLVRSFSADAEVRSKLTSANVAIGCTIASKVGGGKRVRHEAEVATSSSIGSINAKLSANAVSCPDGHLALRSSFHLKIRCWSCGANADIAIGGNGEDFGCSTV